MVHSKIAIVLLIATLFATSKTNAQTDVRMFIFGHSLIDHRPPAIPTPSNETTIPHWMYLLATEAGHTYAAGGQYGFLPQHANVPPISQWGYDIVPGVWESDTESFSAANISTILLTAGNFMQWQAPDLEYPGDPGLTPISATEIVFDWVAQQEDSVRFYIYENWPDMAPYLSAGFPPSADDFSNYNAFTNGVFHDWWLDYHDAILDARPDLKVRMIPVGPILSKLFTELLPGQIPLPELYEDDAPHGRATLYFLASLITYSAVYQEKAPANFAVPNIVYSEVTRNYSQIADFVWDELKKFNLQNGSSRVFFGQTTSVENYSSNDKMSVFPNPNDGVFQVPGKSKDFNFEILDINGISQKFEVKKSNSSITINITSLPDGIYFLKKEDKNTREFRIEKMVKM